MRAARLVDVWRSARAQHGLIGGAYDVLGIQPERDRGIAEALEGARRPLEAQNAVRPVPVAPGPFP
jgi:hypothetical protein